MTTELVRVLRVFLPEVVMSPLPHVSHTRSPPPSRQAKLVLLGDMGTGKSCLVVRFTRGTFDSSHESTIGASYLTKVMPNHGLKLEIWDTAGQVRRGRQLLIYPSLGRHLLSSPYAHNDRGRRGRIRCYRHITPRIKLLVLSRLSPRL